MIDKANKMILIQDFRLMQDFEKSARDQYLQISQDDDVCKAGIQDDFKRISQSEDEHIKIIDTIIELIEKRL